MSSRLAPIYSALEDKKTAVLDRLADWPRKRLDYSPGTDCWSALQVIDHLQRTEAGIVQMMRRNLGKDNAITLKDRAGTAAMLLLMRSPIKVKTPPAASAILPGTDLELPVLAEAWAQTRLEMTRLLPELSVAATSRGLFRHPVSGWMNAPQTLRFLLVHLTHHQYQMKALEERSAPAAA